MNALDLARWQFGVTTAYHFIFIPLTIGLSFLVACLQTAWVRTGKESYLRATKFWGKIFLINFAMGVVTGLVQEFQFGMNWSAYSQFVGDVFGVPLAIEGLLAFFLESVFLGVWIFGWDRLPRRIHLATIWIVAIATQLSAYIILAANSWMQNPVGFTVNDRADGTVRAELTDFVAVLTNSTVLVVFPHVLAACFVTSAVLMLAVCAWHLRRGNHVDALRPSLRLALWTLAISGLAIVVTGDIQGRVITTQQPMKIAAAEALHDTSAPAAFSVVALNPATGRGLEIPHVLSLLATGSADGRVEGVNDLQRQYEQKYGPGDYSPNIPVTYWSFRLMIGLGMISLLIGLAGLWLTRRGRTPTADGRAGRWLWRAAIWTVALPLIANTLGWVLTEMGRQPWVVYGEMTTAEGVSPSVGLGSVATSIIVFTVLYGALAAIETFLLLRAAKAGPETSGGSGPVSPAPDDAEPAIVY